jgi:hypothetical protein
MRFPFRLTADLAFGRTARALSARRDRSFILHLAPDPNFSVTSALAAAKQSPSRIVWIADAGVDPLEHPHVAAVANALAASGRYVFLETQGVLLRRRIHEFKPSPRLYLTVRFDGAEASCDSQMSTDGAFDLALEGIRAARLSGFLLCAHMILHSDSNANELARLQGVLGKLGVDGFLISPAAPTAELQREAAEARRLLLGRRWSQLSCAFDSVALPVVPREPARARRQPLVPPRSVSREESAQLQ